MMKGIKMYYKNEVPDEVLNRYYAKFSSYPNPYDDYVYDVEEYDEDYPIINQNNRWDDYD